MLYYTCLSVVTFPPMEGTFSFWLSWSSEPTMVLGILEMLSKYFLSKWMNEQPIQKDLRDQSSSTPHYLHKGPNNTSKETEQLAKLRQFYLLPPRTFPSFNCPLPHHSHRHFFGLSPANSNSPLTILTYLTLSHFLTATQKNFSFTLLNNKHLL